MALKYDMLKLKNTNQSCNTCPELKSEIITQEKNHDKIISGKVLLEFDLKEVKNKIDLLQTENNDMVEKIKTLMNKISKHENSNDEIHK